MQKPIDRIGKTSKLLLLALLMISLMFFGGPRILRAPEPIHGGKRYREWLQLGIRAGRSSAQSQEADDAIRAIGTNGIAFLVQEVRSRDLCPSKLRDLLPRRFCDGLGIRSAPERHSMAAYGFRVLGRSAEPAVPILIGLIKDSRPNPVAIYALGHIGPVAKPSIPLLTNYLFDRQVEVRRAAVWTLGSIREESSLVIPAFIKSLQNDPDVEVRWRAAWGLGRFGDDAKEAFPALIKLRRDPKIGSIANWAAHTVDFPAARDIQ